MNLPSRHNPGSPPRLSHSFLSPLSSSWSPRLKSLRVEEKKLKPEFCRCICYYLSSYDLTGMNKELSVTQSPGEGRRWSVREAPRIHSAGWGLPWPIGQGPGFWEPPLCYFLGWTQLCSPALNRTPAACGALKKEVGRRGGEGNGNQKEVRNQVRVGGQKFTEEKDRGAGKAWLCSPAWGGGLREVPNPSASQIAHKIGKTLPMRQDWGQIST